QQVGHPHWGKCPTRLHFKTSHEARSRIEVHGHRIAHRQRLAGQRVTGLDLGRGEGIITAHPHLTVAHLDRRVAGRVFHPRPSPEPTPVPSRSPARAENCPGAWRTVSCAWRALSPARTRAPTWVSMCVCPPTVR